ncbi:nuclear transcription factor Y subunit B-3-like [Salvia hispanica]|uniref:nuclear transcription factor Y subunit B-3-like n=1 Tax=Salvia hispanica TaxID=49212 RepID=UPI002008F067|nr:nuclear transcription factor Y subunit B-3-like [Salvia hispanica]
MESGGGFNSQHVASRSEDGASAAAGGGGGGERIEEVAPLQQVPMRRSEQFVPSANVKRIMRRALPLHAKISDDAKDMVQECVTEFIAYVTTEANAKCRGESRITITPEDVVGAMDALGFYNYSDTLALYLAHHRAQDPNRRPVPLPRGRGRGSGSGGGGGGGGEGSSSGAEFGNYNIFQ